MFVVVCGFSAFAYDFSAVCESGQTLYYKITSNVEPYTVEVTSENSNYPYYTTYPEGNIDIPETIDFDDITYWVTSISSCAFANCYGLKSVSIPNSVTSIGYAAFHHVKNIVYDGTATGSPWGALTQNGIIDDGFIYPDAGRTNLTAYIGDGGDLQIPNSVTSIGDYAFYGCIDLTSITIDDLVTTIGNYAFYGCVGLSSVTIGDLVTTIGDYAFYECIGLNELTIGNSVTRIGNDAFRYCDGLTEVTIPNSVTRIEFGAFSDCSNITTVNFNATNCIFMSAVFAGCPLFSTLNIGEGVVNIPEDAFASCSMLTYLTIPNSVTSIGRSAFRSCSGLTGTLTIPNSVASIGGSAFFGCSGLTGALIIPNSVTSIGADAFYNCVGLSSLTIPNSVTSIESEAFLGCSGLTGALIIPNSVTSIGSYAFSRCSGLTTVTIPSSVTRIDNNAFSGCSGMTDIYANPTTPPTLHSSYPTFSNYVATLWVPCGSVGVYDTTAVWSNFTDIRESRVYLLSTESNNNMWGTVGVTQQPNCQDGIAVISATPNDHCYFVQWNDGSTDNPRTIIVTADTTFTASFITDQYTVSVVSADETMGTVSGSGTFDYFTRIWISAIANEHYHFVQWDDGNTNNPRTIIVTSDTTYTASFAIDQHTITILSDDENLGSVVGGGSYDYGTEIQISAIANEHCRFVQWSDGNTDNPRTITVNGDASYTAEFALYQHTVAVSSANDTMGTVNGSGTYDYGSEIQISATASEEYAFLSWNDGHTDNPRTIIVESDTTFTAIFATARTVTIESSDSEMGTVIGSGVYAEGAEIEITAVPYEGYRFDHWVDVDNPSRDFNTDNPRTIVVSTDVTYMAVFTDVVGIEDNGVPAISVFPNPTSDIINITSSETISEIEIVNLMGQLVRRIEVNSDNAVCNVEDLRSGVYVVRIRTALATFSQRKFIKE